MRVYFKESNSHRLSERESRDASLWLALVSVLTVVIACMGGYLS